MNKLLIRAHLETNILDVPLIKGSLKCRPALSLLLEAKSLYVLAYAVAPSHDIGKTVVSALRKGYNASRDRTDTSLNYCIDCLLLNGFDRRNARIKQVAMRLGINLAYTLPRYHGRIEAIVHTLSTALIPHQPVHGHDKSHPMNFETFEMELEHAITAHNETPWRHQLRSPRELLYDQYTAYT